MDITSYLVFFSVVAGIYSISVLGLNLQWGFTGIMNIGVVGVFGVGAYAAALLTGPGLSGFPRRPRPAPVIGYFGAMLASGMARVGLVTIRLRHDFLAVATFGVAVSSQMLAMNLKPLTRGFDGLHSLPRRPSASMAATPFLSNFYFLVMVLCIGGALLWALERMTRSPWGRVLRATHEDEEASAALGKYAVSYRLQAFVLGSMLMGLSGALYASFMGFVSPQDHADLHLPDLRDVDRRGQRQQFWSDPRHGDDLGALDPHRNGAEWVSSPELQRQASAIRVVFVGLILRPHAVSPAGLLPERRNISSFAASRPDKA